MTKSPIFMALSLCAGLATSAAWAAGPSFVGKWHWNKAASTMAEGEPAPQEVWANITSANSNQINWTADITDHTGKHRAETFDGLTDGGFYPVKGSDDTTAAFVMNDGKLTSTFQSKGGATDKQTCALSTDGQKMTCTGIWSDGKGHSDNYVDVYDRS